MNLKRLLIAIFLICNLAGCAASFNSLRNEDTGQLEVIAGTEQEMMSSAQKAILATFPSSRISDLRHGLGFVWENQVLLDKTTFRLLFEEQTGTTSEGQEVTGFIYSIETHGTQPRVGERYIRPLVYEFRRVLTERDIRIIPVKTVAYKRDREGGSGSGKPPARQKVSTGTGFVISKEGHILTNHHVIAGTKEVSLIFTDGKELKAKLLNSDPANDIALLKAEFSGMPLPVTNTANTAKGDEVFTLGYPMLHLQGQEQKATFGRVNALSGIKGDIRLLQIDVPIQPGNSGGPLIDKNGNVIGIVSASLSALHVLKTAGRIPQNVNYAVKADYIFPLVSQYTNLKTTPEVKAVSENPSWSAIVKQVEKSVVLVVAK